MKSYIVEFRITGSKVGFSSDNLNKTNIKYFLMQNLDLLSETAQNSLGCCCSRVDKIKVNDAKISYLDR